MTEPPTSPALARIRAAHDAWADLVAADPALAAAQSAPWALALGKAGLPGPADGWPAYLDAVAPGGKLIEAAAFRQLHMAADAQAHLRARAGGPPAAAGLRGPDGALDLAAFDRLSWEVFELEAAVRALPPAWPSRGSLAGIVAAWRAPQDALRAEAARGHVAAVLARAGARTGRAMDEGDGHERAAAKGADAQREAGEARDPEARLADLAQLAFWAPKLGSEQALAAQVTDHARADVEHLLAGLEQAAPALAAWRSRVREALDDAPLRAFEDAWSRRARVLAERLGDPRQSGAWGPDAVRAAWRDRAEAAAAELEAPLGTLALDWAEAVLGRGTAPDRATVLRVLEWLQRVADGDPRLPALLARCEDLDGEAGRMWRDRRLAVIRERIARPGAPSITE